GEGREVTIRAAPEFDRARPGIKRGFMFEQTFVEGVGKTNRTWTVLLSFAAQIAAIGVAILIPMIYFDALPRTQLTSFLVAPPPPVEQKKATVQRIRVGGQVQQANLIRQPKPVYPPLAKQARIQGVVRFNAIIGKDGTIQNLTLISGHPLLVPAAQEAVKQWLYKPTLLNGEPVEVATVIDVNFTLSQ